MRSTFKNVTIHLENNQIKSNYVIIGIMMNRMKIMHYPSLHVHESVLNFYVMRKFWDEIIISLYVGMKKLW